MLTRILTALCERIDVDQVGRENCKGMAVLPYSTFYPLPYYEIRDLNNPNKRKKMLRKVKASYGMHLWNSITKKSNFELQEKNAINELMRTHCPVVRSTYE